VSTIVRESILGRLRRCDNPACRKMYLPEPREHSGLCQDCQKLTEAEKQATWHEQFDEGDCI
jgi:hypothetical protein